MNFTGRRKGPRSGASYQATEFRQKERRIPTEEIRNHVATVLLDAPRTEGEMRVMSDAPKEASAQCGPLPQDVAGPWSSVLPLQQISNWEMEEGARCTPSKSGLLSEVGLRWETREGMRCKTCDYYKAGDLWASNHTGTCDMYAEPIRGMRSESHEVIYVGEEFGCIHHKEKS